jgi:cation diffusion facilitator CzcD-associated flavoprotein CzcO
MEIQSAWNLGKQLKDFFVINGFETYSPLQKQTYMTE